MECLQEKDHVVKIVDDEDEFSASGLFEIKSWGADLSFRELISMYKDGDLLKPELQRNYVWDKNEASRFIESLLLGLPVPSIFLARRGDSRYLIIDGYQRIMSVYDYVTGIFTKDGKVFKLSNSKAINELWRGKAFSELGDEEQRRIRMTTIHSIIFEQSNPKNDSSLYQIFERINTSGRTLMAQEIRNCVYQGELNSLLIELNSNLKWRMLFGDRELDNRMRDMEFILRFFALSSSELMSKTSGQISLKKYLNDYMGDEENNTAQKIRTLRHEFSLVIEFIYQHLGINAFNNFHANHDGSISYIEKFHPTIFDAISIATLQQINEHGIEAPKHNLRDRQTVLLQNPDFTSATTIRTTNIENIKARIHIARQTLYGEI